MSLEALLEPITPRVNKLCRIGKIIDGLDEPYKSAVTKLVDVTYAHGGLTDAALSQRLAAANFNVSASLIYTHRSGHCSCRKVAVR